MRELNTFGMEEGMAKKFFIIGIISVCVSLFTACGRSETIKGDSEGTVSAQSDPAAEAENGALAIETNSSVDADLSAEEAKTGENQQITVTDLVGREVGIVPGSYQRVVCIGAGALRMYSYVCDPSLLCGVEDIDNPTLSERPQMFDTSPRPYVMAYGDIFETLPSCGVGGPNAQTAEAEKILSCGPDIVISEYEDADRENALQTQLGIPVITLKTGFAGVFAEEFKESLRLLGLIFGEEARAEELIAFVEAEISEIADRTEEIPEEEKPSAYISGLGNWGTTNHRVTAEDYATFDAANVKNTVVGLGIKGMGEIEEEKFIAFGEHMDIMIIDAAAVKNIRPLYAEDPTMFDSCKAWQDGEVYLEMAYNSYYTNYEIALANTWFIAKSVYPEAFADIDMTKKLDEITEAFVGQPLAAEIYACPASFGGYQKIDTAAFFD